MAAEPHLNHVPTRASGVDRAAIQAFYRSRLIGKFFPSGVAMEPVSRTASDSSIVVEPFIRFTDTIEIDGLLPGLAPTGKPVEVAVAVIVGVKDGKITHEHIDWDQGSVLVQVGLFDPKGLSVGGADVARKVRAPNLPSLTF